MRVTLIILFLCFASISYAKTLNQQLAGIRTTKQAKNFLVKDPQYQGRLFQIDANIDTSDFQQPFYSKNSGDIFTIGTETYKVISANTTTLSRARYIFLDGAQSSSRKIDTLRKFILKNILRVFRLTL
jgi:hypothetical protein